MPIEPEQDPTYLSFQRALGFDDADMRAVTARRKASLFRSHQYALPGLQDRFDDANRSISDDFAARGISTSGIAGRQRGDVLNRHTRALGQENVEFADQQGELELALARQLAANQRRLAEESVNARGRLAMDAAGVGQR